MKRVASVLFSAGLVWAAHRVTAPSQVTIDYPERQAPCFHPKSPRPPFSSGMPRRGRSVAGGGDLRRQLARDACPAAGERLRIGEIDPRCESDTNQPPRLTPQQAAARTWTPDPVTWSEMKKRSVARTATVTITGFRDGKLRKPVSRGSVVIRTSRDPAGAPIFYRDVPLMPSEAEKGVIKPLAPAAIPLIAWRLRDLAEPRSRIVLEGMHTCANCHSFSADGKTLGMDLDGPQNDKGLYAISAVRRAPPFGTKT